MTPECGCRESIARSEFDSALESDHTRGAVAAEADAEQASERRDGSLQGAEAGGDEAAGKPGLNGSVEDRSWGGWAAPSKAVS